MIPTRCCESLKGFLHFFHFWWQISFFHFFVFFRSDSFLSTIFFNFFFFFCGCCYLWKKKKLQLLQYDLEFVELSCLLVNSYESRQFLPQICFFFFFKYECIFRVWVITSKASSWWILFCCSHPPALVAIAFPFLPDIQQLPQIRFVPCQCLMSNCYCRLPSQSWTWDFVTISFELFFDAGKTLQTAFWCLAFLYAKLEFEQFFMLKRKTIFTCIFWEKNFQISPNSFHHDQVLESKTIWANFEDLYLPDWVASAGIWIGPSLAWH